MLSCGLDGSFRIGRFVVLPHCGVPEVSSPVGDKVAETWKGRLLYYYCYYRYAVPTGKELPTFRRIVAHNILEDLNLSFSG